MQKQDYFPINWRYFHLVVVVIIIVVMVAIIAIIKLGVIVVDLKEFHHINIK